MHECGTELTLVSLFDGIAGFPLAFSQVARTVATVEIDPAAAGVAADHFPEAKAFRDITEVTGDDLRAAGLCPRCGVLTGGWPCQDLSLAGRRLGLDGARSGLFFEIVRLARDLRPRWLVLENVPGLLSAVCSCPGDNVCGTGCAGPHPVRGGACGPGRCMELHGGAMGAVLGALAELGYGLTYRVLDAQHFGVPQRRRRVVIVGCLGDSGAASAQVLLEPEGGAGDPAPGGTPRTRASGGAEGIVGDAGEPRGRVGRYLGDGVAEPVNALTAGSLAKYDDNSAQGGHLVPATAPTIQGGGRRGFRIDAETAAGGGLVPAPEVWQQQGSKLQPMGTMRRGNGNVTGGVPFVAVDGTPPVAHALTGEGFDASEDGTGRSTPLIAFGHIDSVGPRAQEGATNTVRAGHDAGGGAVLAPTVTAKWAKRVGGPAGSAAETGNLTPALTASAQLGNSSQDELATAASASGSVRRLTPVECERLQGYPDGWTEASSGREQADSARYRQLGNSIAVPVFRWVAHRLARVDRELRSLS